MASTYMYFVSLFRVVQYQRAEFPLLQEAPVDITFQRVCIPGRMIGLVHFVS